MQKPINPLDTARQYTHRCTVCGNFFCRADKRRVLYCGDPCRDGAAAERKQQKLEKKRAAARKRFEKYFVAHPDYWKLIKVLAKWRLVEHGSYSIRDIFGVMRHEYNDQISNNWSKFYKEKLDYEFNKGSESCEK